MIRSSILENIGDAIYAVSADWKVMFFNREAEQYFRRDRSEILGCVLWDCFPAIKGTQVSAALQGVMDSREAIHVDLLGPTTGRWTDVRIFPIEEGGIAVSWRDITEAKEQETALREAIGNQDMLFRELAHRVTNNFQDVAARLTLQARELKDPTARDMCEKMAVSIRCMALVNRRLYDNGGRVDEQDLGEYLEALGRELAASLPENIQISASVEPGVKVSNDVATTVGMMVAELVMNSRKYAWPRGQPGRIVVSLVRDDATIDVEVSDDGRGVPEGMDLRKAAGLGLRLLGLQIARLHGAFTHENVPGGASFRLRFPAAVAMPALAERPAVPRPDQAEG